MPLQLVVDVYPLRSREALLALPSLFQQLCQRHFMTEVIADLDASIEADTGIGRGMGLEGEGTRTESGTGSDPRQSLLSTQHTDQGGGRRQLAVDVTEASDVEKGNAKNRDAGDKVNTEIALTSLQSSLSSPFLIAPLSRSSSSSSLLSFPPLSPSSARSFPSPARSLQLTSLPFKHLKRVYRFQFSMVRDIAYTRMPFAYRLVQLANINCFEWQLHCYVMSHGIIIESTSSE